MKFLITGGCGFLGSNLAVEVLARGGELFLMDNLFREGSYQNLEWLRTQGKIAFHHADVRNYKEMSAIVKAISPDVIFHVAGQVAMTRSIADPMLDFEVNVIGGMNVLEAVREYSENSIVLYSSTNKVYGDLGWIGIEEKESRYVSPGYLYGFPESLPLDFQTPYGCSKGAVDQYMIDYSRVYGIRTVVFRHSSVFGNRQFCTFDQGWIGWFVREALRVKGSSSAGPIRISGDGKQVRDVLFISDLVECYFAAVQRIQEVKGEVFNIGGGVQNSLSLLELFRILEEELNIIIHFEKGVWRQNDQKVFIADIRKAANMFGWEPKIDKIRGLQKMIRWVERTK
jgi:CDP-paratose 2-epimerase